MKKLTLLMLMAAAVAGQGADSKTEKAKPAEKGQFVAATIGEIPQSIYNVPAAATDGRNPFFPNSTTGVVAPAPGPIAGKNSPASVVETTGLVLNGITSPPRRTAMINGRTFEPGEEGEIRLPNGNKLLIKCEEIRDSSAVVLLGGVRRELRLRFL